MFSLTDVNRDSVLFASVQSPRMCTVRQIATLPHPSFSLLLARKFASSAGWVLAAPDGKQLNAMQSGLTATILNTYCISF
jgi:hypothetical protein